MENYFRVVVIRDTYSLGTTQKLQSLVDSRPYPFLVTILEDIFDLDLQNTDVLVDTTNTRSLLDLYKSTIASKVLIVSSNRELMSNNGNELAELAKSLEAKLYLNSLFAGSDKHKLLNINEKNIKSLIADLQSLAVATSDQIANYIYQDLVRAHNKWDPSFEQARRNREIARKEATKQNLYEVAKSLNVELESQPCGIDPKLPDMGDNNE